jgi:pyruvate formate lyase activating enzyme
MNTLPVSRRCFLESLALGAAVSCKSHPSRGEGKSHEAIELGPEVPLELHEARYWKALGENRIQCALCPRGCKVADKERGTCGVRENHDGKYYSLVYARPCTAHVDPIEKKPFYHVLPGETAFSLAAPGCNLECKFCQNWEISQVRLEQVRKVKAPPQTLVELAREYESKAIACTYGEPIVWAEYVYDIAVAARANGVSCLMVSNGFIQSEPLRDLASVLRAIKIDLKAFSEKFYHTQCRGELKPVLDTLRLLAKSKIWFEIVTLVIPGLNDDEVELRALSHFVHEELGVEVPLHFTRFQPAYRMMNVPATPIVTLIRARDVALAEGLHYVYVGNVIGHVGNHTFCPKCGKVVIRRTGLSLLENRLRAGKCPDCGQVIPGIWS